MTATNKKIVYFSVGAILVGSVYFFVKSYFKDNRPIIVGNTKLSLGTTPDDKETPAPTKTSFNPSTKDFGMFEPIKYEPSPVTKFWETK